MFILTLLCQIHKLISIKLLEYKTWIALKESEVIQRENS